MCGITAIYNKGNISADFLQKSNELVSHRGPDDEGYLLYAGAINIYRGQATAKTTLDAIRLSYLPRDSKAWKVGLGHRRLSILDLSPAGHQPMILEYAGLAISYNGEIYNYIEIRKELEILGHSLKTGSDTEVILHAWVEWGTSALHRFNGMFAFVLLDTQRKKMFAVRDRFGVKPLYYTDQLNYFAFASEAKQLRVLPDYEFKLNHQIAYDYLRFGLVDHEEQTFEREIWQLTPGHYIELSLETGQYEKKKWYTLEPREWKGSEQDACNQFYFLLKDSVRLRMRSDVPIGAALSGGLDSSTIVCLMREVLEDGGHVNHSLKSITSCYEDKKYDEWEYAEEVVNRINADSYRVFPSFEKLQHDIDKMLWHLDYPFGSTSQFSQWCVFEEAKRHGLTVMIDGQGADEQLAGYGGNDVSLYSGLLRSFKLRSLASEALDYKKRTGHFPFGFLLGALRYNVPIIDKALPRKYRGEAHTPEWLHHNKFSVKTFKARTLQENLINQLKVLPLPSLLRYEDRNSMAFSVESRVPFMDYRLIEFTLGLDEELIYRKGERKVLLRRAFRDHVPNKIINRKDKMGFVSPEEKWFQNRQDWFCAQLEKTADSSLVDLEEARSLFGQMKSGKVAFDFVPWRLICFSLWTKNLKAS